MDKSHLRVLLVEDDNSTRATVRAMLGEIGVTQVFEANDGAKASDFVDIDMPVDIVISDWNMPEKSGFEFLVHLRHLDKTLPFLMITGRADESSIRDAIGAGVTGYIRKPFSINELNKKIEGIIAKSA